MRGLTLKEFEDVLEFVQINHKFALYIPEEDRPFRKINFPNLPDSHGFSIKYIYSCYDSRDNIIWSITFRHSGYNVEFRTNHYAGLNLPPKHWKYDNLYELCMDYLKGDFVPTEDFINKE